MAIIPWNKKYRETLAVTLERFRSENALYKDAKITYAGRLDPLAEGLLLLLTDDDVHKKDELIGLNKVYQVQFILGYATDSYDILGLVNSYTDFSHSEYDITAEIESLTNISEQSYPPYSSKTVEGKPLWQWAREGVYCADIAPMQSVTISKVKIISKESVTVSDFQHIYINSLDQVVGDFRQEEIISRWNEFFTDKASEIQIYTAEFHVSSGTYIRSLIHQLGKNIKCGAVCLKITRTQVGGYKIES